jgi:hypothetical protein
VKEAKEERKERPRKRRGKRKQTSKEHPIGLPPSDLSSKEEITGLSTQEDGVIGHSDQHHRNQQQDVCNPEVFFIFYFLFFIFYFYFLFFILFFVFCFCLCLCLSVFVFLCF